MHKEEVGSSDKCSDEKDTEVAAALDAVVDGMANAKDGEKVQVSPF